MFPVEATDFYDAASIIPSTTNTPPENTPGLTEAEKTTHVRELNDLLRMTFMGGRVMMTSGISALPVQEQLDIFRKVQEFDSFTQDNDPWREHDYGSFTHNGTLIAWKVDVYDENLEYGSEAPWDASRSTRVLTIMLAEER